MQGGKRKSKRKNALKKKDYRSMSGKNSPAIGNPSSSNSSDEESATDSDATILGDECKTCQSCYALSSVIKQLTLQVTEMQAEIRLLKETKVSSEPNLSVSETTSSEYAELKKEIVDLQEALEERTNRQLRQTLVFRNIPEKPTEKKWADTKDVISEKISDMLNIFTRQGMEYGESLSQEW